MKKQSLIIILAFALSLPVLRPALAHEGGDPQVHIATLRQAATELKDTNADLSKKLEDMADKKEEMVKNWEAGGKMSEQKQQDLDKIRQASTALEAQDKTLAGDLKDISDRWQKKLDEKKQGKDKD
jgi:predicted nuclease with TOPRIM domain